MAKAIPLGSLAGRGRDAALRWLRGPTYSGTMRPPTAADKLRRCADLWPTDGHRAGQAHALAVAAPRGHAHAGREASIRTAGGSTRRGRAAADAAALQSRHAAGRTRETA